MRECNTCKDAEVPQQLIGFEKKEDNSIAVKPFGNQKTKKVKDSSINSIWKMPKSNKHFSVDRL
jgi:hypothetical protein